MKLKRTLTWLVGLNALVIQNLPHMEIQVCDILHAPMVNSDDTLIFCPHFTGKYSNIFKYSMSSSLIFFFIFCSVIQLSMDMYTRDGTSTQISGQAGYRVRKLNSGPGPGRVITTRKKYLHYSTDKIHRY